MDTPTRQRHGRTLLSALTAALGAGALLVAMAPAAHADTRLHVIGGQDATEQYPFMVSLRDNQGTHGCGGALIDAEWVVTAGHCAAFRHPEQITARVGSNDRTAGGTEAAVSRIALHPGFSSGSSWAADIALLKLDRPVPQEPISIGPEAGGAGTPVRILGWGMTCDDAEECPPPADLQEVDSELVPADRCTDADAGSELCVEHPTEQAQACSGDSGGPLVRGGPGRWELVGATSRDGDDNAVCATGPGIWTDVTVYADWIERTVAG
ncbi:S1 family peptidase [Marinitenerispora sediminis]|uniref:Serine protease n=1 Tax=Marinitenerispora sediminis TaxID=1931232 RepID=A0A368T3G3_9ACTN|nr:serine protease [Marinitenerispora sediminis]RCV48280.1 serine protease [Marinitenerispora sediminis]RCV49340.1 serine protease [Marinitenerispora sediminis]RCV56461.1 serine protease [Marinitenerispora sediminis]